MVIMFEIASFFKPSSLPADLALKRLREGDAGRLSEAPGRRAQLFSKGHPFAL